MDINTDLKNHILYKNNKKKIKNKILNYQKKIFSFEQKYILSSMPKINSKIFDDMIKKISNYKLIVKILYSSPDFYLDIKYIQIDYFREPNEVACLESIWNVEHYEYMETIKNTETDILQLIKFATKYNLMSYIQAKFVKKMIKKINLIFESDKSMENLYGIQPDIKLIISETDLELFFNILNIVFIKINVHIYNTDLKLPNILDISNNIKYSNLIKKIKLNLEKLNY